MSEPVTFRALVYGRVQGVGYRAWTEGQAQRRGLRGWCKNENDGSVTVVVSGPAEDVNTFLAALEDGPGAARVDSVKIQDEASAPDAPGFKIRR